MIICRKADTGKTPCAVVFVWHRLALWKCTADLLLVEMRDLCAARENFRRVWRSSWFDALSLLTDEEVT